VNARAGDRSQSDLATEANPIVPPIHPKAMPVILTSPAEVDQWLEADTSDALALPAAVA
jgi:putative SOS response-associated peptidase YedK